MLVGHHTLQNPVSTTLRRPRIREIPHMLNAVDGEVVASGAELCALIDIRAVTCGGNRTRD